MKRRYLWAIVILITLLSMLIAYPRESDAEGGKCKIPIKFDESNQQKNDNWCWVATVSMVLKWHDLSNVEQCQLYDLAKPNATSCKDMENFPNEWMHLKDGNNVEKNNQFGSPQKAAEAYHDHHPNKIEFEVRTEPFPSFEELANQICPNGRQGSTPFIWAYDLDNAAHDVVVYGYNDSGEGEDNLIYYHNLNSNPADALLDPDFNHVTFAAYADDPPFNQDFFIKKK